MIARNLRCSSHLVSAVLVIISGNWIAGVRRVVTIVVHLGETHVPIRKRDNTLGIAIEWRVGFSSFAAVPRQRRMGSPFHDQQCRLWLIDRGHFPSGNVGHSWERHSIEDIASVIKTLC